MRLRTAMFTERAQRIIREADEMINEIQAFEVIGEKLDWSGSVTLGLLLERNGLPHYGKAVRRGHDMAQQMREAKVRG